MQVAPVVHEAELHGVPAAAGTWLTPLPGSHTSTVHEFPSLIAMQAP